MNQNPRHKPVLRKVIIHTPKNLLLFFYFFFTIYGSNLKNQGLKMYQMKW